jgi:phosphohistidine phosphatase
VVARHAKAEQDGSTDAARLLSDSGRLDAAEAGTWLAARGVQPDAALVSAATRTEMTWEAISEAAGFDAELLLDEGLYDAGPETALDLVRQTDPTVVTLVVVGHNPTVAFLAQLLDDGEGDEQASNEMALGFPTCALAVFTYDGEWSDLDEASARVTGFHVGRA